MKNLAASQVQLIVFPIQGVLKNPLSRNFQKVAFIEERGALRGTRHLLETGDFPTIVMSIEGCHLNPNMSSRPQGEISIPAYAIDTTPRSLDMGFLPLVEIIVSDGRQDHFR